MTQQNNHPTTPETHLHPATKSRSAVQMVKEALDKVAQFSDYNIFTELCQEEALKKAAAIDQKIANGDPVGPLAGIPYALKDNFLAPVGHTTAASRILEPFASPITATAVQKLEAAGAICIGRTNLDAFAHGSSTENSYFGPTKNSADPTRVAGGSSGGSAVAVALGIVPFATGTDTGGSIRQPASFNGVFGFKPTYGTISRYGVVAMASSTDCIGFFTRSAADLDLLMQICAGQDEKDLTTLPDFYQSSFLRGDPAVADSNSTAETPALTGSTPSPETPTLTPNKTPTPSHPLTLGLIQDFNTSTISPAIRQALATKVAHLKQQGHKIIELDMPTLKHALAVYYIVVPAEVSSNLSRYDGIRYGLRAPDAQNLAEIYNHSRNLGFMPENKRRIMIGNFVLSSGFYDAYYLKAQQVRTLIIQEYAEAFKKCDFILTPVSPSPAFKLGEKTSDPITMYLEDILTVPVSLAGLPALTVPAGTTADFTSDNTENTQSSNYSTLSDKSQAQNPDPALPIGLQLIGPRRSDAHLLKFAEELSNA